MSDQPRPPSSSPGGDARGSHPSLVAELSATAHRVEHVVEEKLEHGIEVAEQTIARRFGLGALRVVRGTLRFAFWSLVAAYFAFGALLLVTRHYVLPRIDQWRPLVEEVAGRALQGRVAIGRIEAGWRGFNPHLSLNDVQVTGPRGGPPLALPRVDATVSWFSLLAMEPRFVTLRLLAPQVSIVRLADGNFTVAGFVIQPGAQDSEESPALDWLLAQRRIVVRDGQVAYRDDRGSEPRLTELHELNLIVEQSLGSHLFALNARPTSAFAGPVDLRGKFTTGAFARPSQLRYWTGEAYARLDYLDLAQATQFVNVPVEIRHAHGALRAWIGFEGGNITRTTADVALQDVVTRVAPDLALLQLTSLQGRFTQRQWGDFWPIGRGGQEFALMGASFRTADGLTFPPIDVKLRRTRAAGQDPQRTEVEASRLDLESLAAIAAHFPLPRELRETIEKHALRGTLAGLSLGWSGDAPAATEVALKARFYGLASAAQPVAAEPGQAPSVGLPGFENLSGTVRLERGAGTLELASSDAVLVFPGVFEEPRLPLKQLLGTIQWKQGEVLEASAEALRLSNDDADVSVTGTYRRGSAGPGAVDLTARIARASASTAHRYIPLVAGETTRRWLQHALVGGRLTEGTARVRGELARFPFMNPAEGEFRIAGRVAGATLDVYPMAMREGAPRAEPGAIWPVLSEIDADLLFDRASMNINAQRARALGARIEQATAHIAHLGHDARLDVRGRANGPLADMVRYVNASPVKGWIGGITEGADAQGNARLELDLRIPLGHPSDSKVNGTLALQNNTITLAGIPSFVRTSGAVGFHERGVRISNLTTTLLGGPARLDATTRADGALVFNAAGSAAPAGLRPAVPVGPVQRLLDRSNGTARYQATVTVKDGTELRIDSDLVGLAIDGVAPLRKAAGEAFPVRIERRATGAGDDLRVQAGKALAVRIERKPGERGELQLARGVVALNEPANLPEQGLLVIAALPRIDVDQWANLLFPDSGPARAPRAAAGADDLRADLIALRTPELLAYGHRIQNLTLGATRLPDGGYGANIVSDGATGSVTWRPSGDPQSAGHITARLSRLVITPNKEKEVVEALRTPPRQIPALEVGVEQFELSDMKLGRLDLVAQNVGSGANAAWRVRRLDIANPDMKLAASGEWGPGTGGAGRRTQLKFGIDVFDGGGTLGRLGFPDALSNGTGRLEGEVNWTGSPFDIDYPTLSGRVNLSVDNGRFLKVDAGNAARLLALLSLQSLGRNLAADGGRQFTEGFAFTSIRGDAAIERGVLRTENFRMNGASAAVLMSGSLDLRNETQQLSIVVLPEIDASTAALALGVANPVLGLGTFLAQLVLKDPLSRAFAIQYDVTGSWTDPRIARRSRIAPSPTTEATK